MDTNDPLRASLRAIWASAAPSWGQHAGHIDTRSALVAQAMLDAAGLHRGARVIELACGPGGVGMAAAEIVGPDGAVVLSDFAPEMTAIAAARAEVAGLTNVTTREVNLEQIDYPDAAFDAVLCREGLMLVPDPASAVAGGPPDPAPGRPRGLHRLGTPSTQSMVGPAVRRNHSAGGGVDPAARRPRAVLA
jgi:SAM-dependent methyltransferase